ncbi:peptidyl-prolyl cis-trans isomerase FKBP20-1-like [Gastrolobium bilobum]|uniref:peptidyl-prolyl cis-trans isomerase FKBP20-1-like n=1 Tax=Gastrolobium bilobum TaxID=150636 RepID=UPI002AB2446E|nr:peptidyl-prolyl cis-trans isomerase FKBP20-1-like [Gastrolobium bilobum]
MCDAIDLNRVGGVIKTIVRKSKSDAVAPTEDFRVVDVHYMKACLLILENYLTLHEDNNIFTFELGKGNVIKAWDIAVRTMKVNEIVKIKCKPEYAYGSAGFPPDIIPDATLVFEVPCSSIDPPFS